MRLSKHRLVSNSVATLALLLICQCFAQTDAFAQVPPTQRTVDARRVIQPSAPAEITVSFTEQLANSFLDALFTNLQAPVFPLSIASKNAPDNASGKRVSALAIGNKSACASEVILQREVDGVRTAIHFTNNRIVAPLAFTGSYNTGLLGCVRFRGWTNALINLEYDRQRQSLRARVAVQDFHLNDLSARASGIVKGLVQNAIDKRANPFEILQATQLAARLPISAAGGALRLRVTDVRPEILQHELRLHLFYQFVRAE